VAKDPVKKSFIVYTSYRAQIELLDDSQIGRLFRAMLSYADGEEPEIPDPVVGMAFSFIKSQLDRDIEKYNEVAEKNRVNGAKGGRPKKDESRPKQDKAE
jgi:hypothetical protein